MGDTGLHKAAYPGTGVEAQNSMVSKIVLVVNELFYVEPKC